MNETFRITIQCTVAFPAGRLSAVYSALSQRSQASIASMRMNSMSIRGDWIGRGKRIWEGRDDLYKAEIRFERVDAGACGEHQSSASDEFSRQEAAAILASLSYWKREGWISSGHEHEIANDRGRLRPLTAAQLELFIQRLERKYGISTQGGA